MVVGSRPGRFIPGKEPSYLLNRRLSEPHNQSGRLGGEKNLLLIPEFEPQNVQPVAEYIT
jgi:hypothetical protein